MSSNNTINQSNRPSVLYIDFSDDDDDSLPAPAFASSECIKTEVKAPPTVSPTSSISTSITSITTTKEIINKVKPFSGASAAATEVVPETKGKAKCTKKKATFAFEGEPGQLLLINGTVIPDDKDPRNPNKGYQKRTIPKLLIEAEPGQKNEAEGLLMLHVILEYIENVTSTAFFAHGKYLNHLDAIYDCSFTQATARLKQ